ncbi:M20/M25/M40 family metallo-hydrolase (plasmid) [Vibrio coralliilyticus]|uniref:M20/M25/M40 family metallo-hydrolase n=1 Tax=Vibrio coralliilyticus TaxID=190893 RepID=UPI00051281D2|nr:M20/M25/M40 family metallo-hydrolase [Vibrio coralliilyticus]AIS58296.1 hypothetical protein JV59_25005 [Vibrio coralliilyticus]
MTRLKPFVLCTAVLSGLLFATLFARAWWLGQPLPVATQRVASPASTAQIERLSQAIQYPTVSRLSGADASLPRVEPRVFRAFHQWLSTAYPLVHRHLELEIVNRFSLLFRWRGTNPTAPPIVLAAHQDVVPYSVTARDQWIHPPYSGAIDEGHVWGRGTLDNKASMLAILESVEASLASGHHPDRDIYLAFGHDEEVGGEHGAQAMAALLKSRGVQPSFVLDEGGFVLEGVVPGVPVPVALIGVAEKGYLNVTLSAPGVPGHSSMPPTQSAPGRLARAITRLEAQPLPAQYGGATQQLFDATSSYMSLGYRILFANLWLLEPLLLEQLTANPPTNAVVRTTQAVTLLRSGIKDNVLPSVASANVNVRLLPGVTPDQVIAHMTSVIDDPAIRVQIAPPANLATPVADTSGHEFSRLRRAVGSVFGDRQTVVAPYLTINATDARHYLPLTDKLYRFLPLALKDDDLARIHGPNERISVQAYGQMLAFYATLLEAFTVLPVPSKKV